MVACFFVESSHACVALLDSLRVVGADMQVAPRPSTDWLSETIPTGDVVRSACTNQKLVCKSMVYLYLSVYFIHMFFFYISQFNFLYV